MDEDHLVFGFNTLASHSKQLISCSEELHHLLFPVVAAEFLFWHGKNSCYFKVIKLISCFWKVSSAQCVCNEKLFVFLVFDVKVVAHEFHELFLQSQGTLMKGFLENSLKRLVICLHNQTQWPVILSRSEHTGFEWVWGLLMHRQTRQQADCLEIKLFEGRCHWYPQTECMV